MRSLVSRGDRGYWVHRWARGPACFHARRSAVHLDRYLRSYGTLPRPFSLETVSSSEFLELSRSSRLSTPATTYQGFCPLRDITTARLPNARVPDSSLCSVLRRSQPLDGLLRTVAWGLLSSPSRPEDPSRTGVSPLCAATLPPREELPPCRWREVRSPTSRLPRSSCLDFEAFFHAESRVERSAVRPHQRPLPSSVSLLLQASSRPLPPVPQRQTLLTFLVPVLDRASATDGGDEPPSAL